jgi:hypothetical protein
MKYENGYSGVDMRTGSRKNRRPRDEKEVGYAMGGLRREKDGAS